jgi:hypothetical protein
MFATHIKELLRANFNWGIASLVGYVLYAHCQVSNAGSRCLDGLADQPFQTLRTLFRCQLRIDRLTILKRFLNLLPFNNELALLETDPLSIHREVEVSVSTVWT